MCNREDGYVNGETGGRKEERVSERDNRKARIAILLITRKGGTWFF